MDEGSAYYMNQLKWLNRFLITIFLCVFIFIGYVISHIPSDQTIKGCLTTTMFKVYLCPGSKDYVRMGLISRHLQRAIIQTEDAAFYSHEGFDMDELAKSARLNWQKGEYKRGGSTITQQLAKNMFLSQEKSLMRKLLEAFITLKIEKVLKKGEIFERYLNVVEFGKNIYGVKKAADFYFHKLPSELSVVESAFLAMLLPNPKKYSQSYFKKSLTRFAKNRISQIVYGLYKTGRITEEEYADAVSEIPYFLGPEPVMTDDNVAVDELESMESAEDE